MIVAAIDTDVHGAIGKLDTKTNKLTLYTLPRIKVKVNKTMRWRLDVPKVCALLNHVLKDVDHILLEKQGARPQQGGASIFSFGTTYGTLIGITNSVMLGSTDNIHLITPSVWKGGLGVTKDKKLTVARATELAPNAAQAWKMVKNTSAAESFLMCLYLAGKLGITIARKPITPVKDKYKELTSLT